MSIPLFYISESVCDSLDQLRQLEVPGVAELVSDVADSGRISVSQLAKGPDGKRGCLFAVAPADGELDACVYRPNHQQWTQSTKQVWVGGDGEPPTPEELLRHGRLSTETEVVQMQNGSLWDVPRLREPVTGGILDLAAVFHRTTLPSTFVQSIDEIWQQKVLPDYQELFEHSRFWFEWLLRDVELGHQVDFGHPGMFEFALRVISLRYRYTKILHNVFGQKLLTTETIGEVVRVATGWYVVLRFQDQKKSGARILV